MRDVHTRAPAVGRELLEARQVCPLSGKPVGPACPEAVTRHFLPERATGETGAGGPCELHPTPSRARRPGRDSRPGAASRPAPAAIVVLPDEYGEWLASQPLGAPGRDTDGATWFARSARAGCARSRHRAAQARVDEPVSGSVLVLSRAEPTRSQQLELRASMLGQRWPERRRGRVRARRCGRGARRTVPRERGALARRSRAARAAGRSAARARARHEPLQRAVRSSRGIGCARLELGLAFAGRSRQRAPAPCFPDERPMMASQRAHPRRSARAGSPLHRGCVVRSRHRARAGPGQRKDAASVAAW